MENPGDTNPAGHPVVELRTDHGPGYRIYYVQRGEVVAILLCGGDKSTHERDIRSAHAMLPHLNMARPMTPTRIKTRSWDSAEYLQTEDDIAEYIEACLQEGGDDPAFIAHALGVIARARGMAQVARDTGISREGLYKALSEDGNPSFGTILKVIKALGLQLHGSKAGT
ncbi:transcriptional regulator [Caballeronia peredens]|nr:transcriptional regulator [Caballeronia peredens]